MWCSQLVHVVLSFDINNLTEHENQMRSLWDDNKIGQNRSPCNPSKTECLSFCLKWVAAASVLSTALSPFQLALSVIRVAEYPATELSLLSDSTQIRIDSYFLRPSLSNITQIHNLFLLTFFYWKPLPQFPRVDLSPSLRHIIHQTCQLQMCFWGLHQKDTDILSQNTWLKNIGKKCWLRDSQHLLA